MADYDLEAKITADASGYEAGVKKAEKASKKLSTSVSKVIQGLGKNGLVGALGAVGLASSGLSATLGSVVKIARKVSETINECTNAYKNQLIAEKALNTAIKNNPFVTGESSKALLQFASDMQKVSNYGDDELIPMMTNLISLGRSEAETMQIMSVAMDMSAVMGISLDSAITQLNATLNGNIGRLGQQNAELKDLTEEELKNGKAIDILGEKFKGLSQATLDTSKQLKNIKGDFKEAIGEFTLPSSDMWNKFWTGFYEKGIEIINKFNDALDKGIIGKGIASSLEGELKKLTDTRERRLYSEDEIHLLSDEQLKALRGYLESLKKLNKEQQVLLQVAKDEKDSREYNAKIAKEIQEDEAKLAKIKAEEAEKEKVVVDLKAEYLDKIKKQETEWENIKKITGEAVTAEEKLKFYQNSLVSLMTEAGGQITENNQLYKDQIAIIQKLQKELDPEEEKTSLEWEKKLREQAIERLETEKQVKIESAELLKQSDWEKYQIERQYNEKIKKLALERIDTEMEEALKAVAEYANAEEEKARIIEYYKNEREKIVDEYTAKYKETNKEEKNDTKKTLKDTLRFWKSYARDVGRVLKEIGGFVADAMKSVANFIKTGVSDLSKLFRLNIDEALEKMLEFEDRVLTFFMNTLPKLPSFVQSALQSIQVLFETLENSIDSSLISNIILSMVNSLVEMLPRILTSLGKVISEIMGGILEGISASLPSLNSLADSVEEIFKNFANRIKEQAPIFDEVINGIAELLSNFITSIVDSGVIDSLSEIAGSIVTTLVNGFDKMLPAISKGLGAIIPAIGDFLREAIPSVINLLFDFIGVIAENLPSIISELIKSLPTLITSIIEKIPVFFREDFPKLLSGLINLLPDIIKVAVQLTVEIIKHLPEIIGSIITGLIQGFAQVNWWEVIKSIFQAFIDGFKALFGIHSPSTVFEGFGQNIFQGLVNGLKGIGEWFINIFTTAWEGIKNAFSAVGEWASGVWTDIKKGFSNVGLWFYDVFTSAGYYITKAFKDLGSWASGVWGKIKEGFGNVGEWFKEKFTNARENVSNAFSNIKDWASGVWGKIKDGFANVGSWFSTTFSNARENMGNAFSNIGNWASGVWSDIKSGFSNVGDWFSTTFQSAGSKIKNAFASVGNWFSNLWDKITGKTKEEPIEIAEPKIIWTGTSPSSEGTQFYAPSSVTVGSIEEDEKKRLEEIKKNMKISIQGHAKGVAHAMSGLSLVGEAGPELVRFRGGEQVLNNRNTNKALAEMGSKSNVFNVTFNNTVDTTAYAMMSQLKKYQRNLAFNGVL